MTLIKTTYDAVVVGAGFAGMYMLIRLRELGLSARVIDSAEGVGGTWYWNRYPGARCDIESMQYSYSFSDALQQEWQWSERYATQPEILDYANHVADRFQLRDDIQLGYQVVSCIYDCGRGGWHTAIASSSGNQETIDSRFVIMATGCLSTPNLPHINGLDNFAGSIYHTAKWPHHAVDFSQQKVAVIGTGSSGIQAITEIAKHAAKLTVMQRTPNYVVSANSKPLQEGEQVEVKRNYKKLREKAKLSRNGVAFDFVTTPALSLSVEARQAHYEARWQRGGLTFAGAFPDLILNQQANDTAAEFVRGKIREMVDDVEVAELLTPKSTFACKRLCVANGYYETFNLSNVELVDISECGIEQVESNGIRAGGKLHEVDALVLATGFDAMTGSLNQIKIKGSNGQLLSDEWLDGSATYLGLMVSGFPNFFAITGPGSPSVLSNVLGSIEYHVDWIIDCIAHMQQQKIDTVEATAQAQSDWTDEVNAVVDRTLYRSCDSWYLGSNISGKKRVFMPYPGVPSYTERCTRIARDGYPGLMFQRRTDTTRVKA